MIDAKTRDKIIKLWMEDESKASIGRKTKVSQPTIRKVIIEAGMDKRSSNEKVEPQPLVLGDFERRLQKVEEISNRHERWWGEIPTSDKFIINLTRGYPYGNNTPLECLKNGVPYFDLEQVLLKFLPPKSAST
jgi:hypothetical protein